ncbi:hypothetical protein [Lacipirellula sp.]|uniref:hypothetical protein n=1 Tax=Lacipirellula sp. TaxID=2691419 RepID=UPI003D0FBB81
MSETNSNTSDDSPQFHGHPIAYWLEKRLSGDDEERWEVIDAIRHLCYPATSIPLFLATLREDSYSRARALAAHAIFDLVIDPSDHDFVLTLLPPLSEFANDPSPEVCEQISQTIALIEN